MFYRVKTTYIDYCVEPEDLDYLWPECQDWEDEDFDRKIAEIKSELPQELELEIECDKEDLDDMVCDAISEETGWLINSFDYKILERKSSRSLI